MKIHKKIIVFGLILTFVMGSVKINQIIKGSSEIIYNEHEYKLFSLSKTWNKAKADCEAQGGHLVTISSKEENAFVSNLAGSENIWIGLTDEIHEGSWQWANGESLIYTKWDSEEPNDSGAGEDYAMMYGNGLWNDAGPPGSSDEIYAYVCEWEEGDTYSGLVLHLPMDEGFGTIVFDQSGNNNHGTILEANWTMSGKSGNALEFDGQDDCIEVNPPPDLSTRFYTISVWTFFDKAPDPTEEWRYAIICQDDFKTRVIQLNTYGDMFTLHRFGWDRNLFSYNTTIEAHRWYHVAVTFEGNYYRLYVDGVINDEQTGSFTPNKTLSLIIGAHNPDDYPFDGIIDEVRIYNRSLTMNEIKQLASGDVQDTTSTSESKTSTTFESQSIPAITPGFQLFSCIFILPIFILILKIVRKSKEVRK
ncbi:MAG: LamG-like jellyroll fold domain-containing protein [Candidatus Hodarchaeales archaeon]|jgi:hypothetical protein